MFDLTDKVAVVTGGTGVLGQAICTGLAQAGAKLAILGTTSEKAQAVAAQFEGTMGLGCDVLKRDQLEATAQTIMKHFGKVDILINGAGGNRPTATTSADQPFFDLPPDAAQFVFDLNFMGTLLPSQVFGKLMSQQGQGVILNISSVSSLRPLTRVVAYGGAKAAVNNFTQWLAVHLAQAYSPQLRVNAIAPGFFLTEQNRYLLTDKTTGELTPRGQQILSHTPAARFGQPDDLIGAVLWLVSDASRFVTGIVVPIDGGFSAYSGV